MAETPGVRPAIKDPSQRKDWSVAEALQLARHVVCASPDATDNAPSVALACAGVGPQLLDAVQNLTRLLTQQSNRLQAHSIDEAEAPHRPSWSLSLDLEQHTSNVKLFVQNTDTSTPLRLPDEQHEEAINFGGLAGLDSILTWKSLLPLTHDLPSPVGVCGASRAEPSPLTAPDLRELYRLEIKYATALHVKNALLDPLVLHGYVIEVSRNGLDGSSKSCLVCLVCALGAIIGCDSSTPVLPGEPLDANDMSSEPELAQIFFDAALTRLGNAVCDDSVLAAQCACLAGLQPLKAWKYFNLAGSIWCISSFFSPYCQNKSDPSLDANFLAVERNLFFAIFRSESELRMELDLPKSSLVDIELSTSFPQPPALGGYDPGRKVETDLRSWYYILAEIAIRHLLNRLLRFQAATYGEMNEPMILQMTKDADVFMCQLQEWYRLLPPIFQFEEPRGSYLDVEPDDMRFVLRFRYMSCRDLISRPFLRLRLTGDAQMENPELRSAVSKRASICIEMCMLKMTQIRLDWHQGTWFTLRTQATNAATILAVALAKQTANLESGSDLELPAVWRDRINDLLQAMAPFWSDREGRLAHIRMFLERGLSATRSI
ncbi:hypothetical protein E4T38_08164 [Aureobasidium subglaciale]|nr:hypothetical protein E4T38_08164 [Aureobasidium subglaciale]KAI5215774.1 hypothetical protein E4T40_08174 [Aureobasidium subglaciale]KAI5219041.1 hypothetical protein E4T41_08089 [Aureobasidium subglaciale]KAI5256597.1 hypothetical protein E4T46_08065 [Aureobasidium subglaciale]